MNGGKMVLSDVCVILSYRDRISVCEIYAEPKYAGMSVRSQTSVFLTLVETVVGAHSNGTKAFATARELILWVQNARSRRFLCSHVLIGMLRVKGLMHITE